MNGGYNSVFSEYRDYYGAVRIILGAYTQRLKASVPDERLYSRAARAVRPEGDFSGLPFVLAGEEHRKFEALLSEISDKTKNTEIFLPFDYVCSAFSMSEGERLAFAACILRSLHSELAEVFAYINNDINMTFPTLSTVCSVFLSGDERTAYNALTSYIPMLFEVKAGETDFSCVELKPRRRVLDLLLGMEFLHNLPYSHTFAVNDPVDEICGREKELSAAQKAFSDEGCSVLLIEGAGGMGKRFFVKHCGIICRKNVIFADVDKIPENELSLAVSELQRETILQRAVCCFVGVTEKNSEKAGRAARGLIPSQKLIFMTAESPVKFGSLPVCRLRLEDLTFEEKQKIWDSFSVPAENPETVAKLAASYDFPPSKIKKIIIECERAAGLLGCEKITDEILKSVCLAESEGILKDKASRIQTSFRLCDLILPQSEKLQIVDGINYIRYRHTVYDSWKFKEKTGTGTGLSMLFEGSPGTGKTMAASIVANELGLALFKVDLSKMMSKYIGETEKSLDEVFNIAERSSAVLLFDETDALFGRRSEIKDSHDKYANVETSFLLQKMDEFRGIIIMTTNFKQNIDDAFMRRITYIIHFPQPDAELRLELWKNAFPREAPADKGIDFGFLAERFEMTGAMIKGAAVSAAFSAAARGGNISMSDVVRAVKKQFAKFGKNIPSADFGPYSLYIDNSDI